MSAKITAPGVGAMKTKTQRIVCVTAYDAPFARIADAAGVDIVLVGDSVGNVVLGYETTIPVTMDEMLHHLRAVRRGVQRALVVADMPFGSYGASVAQAVESAAILAKAGAEAVKLEGDFPAEVEAICKTGIPVMGHLGLTPQSVHRFGGHKIQGRGEAGDRLLDAAKRLEGAGAFSLVLELIPSTLAQRVTMELLIPTIGIGAGANCDGQVQVMHDLLGLGDVEFRHAKRYLEGASLVREALASFSKEVREGAFPLEKHSV